MNARNCFYCVIFVLSVVRLLAEEPFGFYRLDETSKLRVTIQSKEVPVRRIFSGSIVSVGVVSDGGKWFVRAFVKQPKDMPDSLEEIPMVFMKASEPAKEIRFIRVGHGGAKVIGQAKGATDEISIRMNSLVEALEVAAKLLTLEKVDEQFFFFVGP